MKMKRAIFLLVFALSGGLAGAQSTCKTYACFLCEWGGEFTVTAPTIFTPNNDEVNDIWLPIVVNPSCLAEINISIYNHWGQLVYESSVQNEGWNGNTVSGLKHTEGTYYYFMSYTNLTTKETKSVKGFLQLER